MIEFSAGVPQPTDFWGVVFPAYLGAAGAIISGGVAAWALIREVGTRKGLAEVARDANRAAAVSGPPRAIQNLGAATAAAAREEAKDETPTATQASRSTSRDVNPWEIHTLRRGHYILRNASERPTTLTGFDTAGHIVIPFSMPLTVQPGEGYEFYVHHVAGGPAILTVEFRWEAPDGSERSWRQFL
ncbi:hypothetical protein LQ757_01110 [Agromyces sp. SYSU K20354]|uniref:hypothetical protein n=1 Tax=Agromyces cavernae TaxID=2898659 RepID=UPI001E5DCF3F|nr:hypothetical protein [Agromyces cavernae]MCD2440863.1 hypothetical protein [Agromyces cavernae]